MTEDKKDKKGYFTPDKSVDIASMCRKTVMENWAHRNSNDMWALYGAWIGKLEEYQDIFKEIKETCEKMMEAEETSLLNNNTLDPKHWWGWWKLLEKVGARIDYTGQIIKKPGLEQDSVMVINDPIYNYDIVFGGLTRELFGAGKDNCVVGGKGSGKSNYLLNLGFEAIQMGFPRYELATNIGILNNKDPKIHKVAWMSDLLKVACDNLRKNIELRKKGKEDYITTLICIIDETDNFIMALRSMSSENIDFNQFIQWTRKLDMSITLIGHREKDFPSNIIKSPNLNAIIYKGIDEENNELTDPQGEAIIIFKKKRVRIHMDEIPKNKDLDTRHFGSFRIKEKDLAPEKSVEIKEIFSLTGGAETEEIPKIISDYLKKIEHQNLKRDVVVKIVKEVERQSRSKLYACKSKIEYITLVSKDFCESFKLKDVSEMNYLKETIEKIAKESFYLQNIQERMDKDFDFKKCNVDELAIFLRENKTFALKGIVNRDYREIDEDEITYLLDNKISKRSLMAVYGQRKEILYYQH